MAIGLGAAAALGLAVSASADVKLDVSPYSVGNGGAFKLTSISGWNGVTGVDGSFLTFCLEKDEFFAPGTIYKATMSTAAKDGGQGGPSPDPISSETAYLYTQFRAGTLANFNYSTAADYGLLQNAIWAFEQEMSMPAPGVNKFVDAANNANFLGIGLVRVLNITKFNGGHVQDQLTIVPLPASVWAGGAMLAGLAGAGYIRRRR
jgi:hypothetical protein